MIYLRFVYVATYKRASLHAVQREDSDGSAPPQVVYLSLFFFITFFDFVVRAWSASTAKAKDDHTVLLPTFSLLFFPPFTFSSLPPSLFLLPFPLVRSMGVCEHTPLCCCCWWFV